MNRFVSTWRDQWWHFRVTVADRKMRFSSKFTESIQSIYESIRLDVARSMVTFSGYCSSTANCVFYQNAQNPYKLYTNRFVLTWWDQWWQFQVTVAWPQTAFFIKMHGIHTMYIRICSSWRGEFLFELSLRENSQNIDDHNNRAERYVFLLSGFLFCNILLYVWMPNAFFRNIFKSDFSKSRLYFRAQRQIPSRNNKNWEKN
jgi:hypothetical protein